MPCHVTLRSAPLRSAPFCYVACYECMSVRVYVCVCLSLCVRAAVLLCLSVFFACFHTLKATQHKFDRYVRRYVVVCGDELSVERGLRSVQC